MDFKDVDRPTATNDLRVDPSWHGYPQNLFGNWTQTQVEHSQMLAKCSNNASSTIYWMDVGDDGKFTKPKVTESSHISTVTTADPEPFWNMLQREVNLACHLCPRLGG